jgi:hypothetical protein
MLRVENIYMGHRVPKINMEILVDLGAKGPTRLDIFNKAQLNTEVSGASIILSMAMHGIDL